MFYHFSIGIESVNINTSYTPVIRIIIIQVDKVYMCSHPVVTCNNTIYLYKQILPCSNKTAKELAQGFSSSGNYGIMLDVVRHQVLFSSLYRLFLLIISSYKARTASTLRLLCALCAIIRGFILFHQIQYLRFHYIQLFIFHCPN